MKKRRRRKRGWNPLARRSPKLACPQCGVSVSMKRDLKKRQVEGYEGVVQLYIECRRGHETHSYFLNRETENLRVAYRQALTIAVNTQEEKDVIRAKLREQAYQKAHDELQRRMKDALGME